MSKSFTGDAPLSGIKVIDVSMALAGPLSTMMLGDWGADITKVERPSGDRYRSAGHVELRGERATFLSVNRNKRSISIDLKKEAGQRIVRHLVSSADVFVQNFLPGSMERIGLGYDDLRELNPRLVYCSVSGFGGRSGYDQRRALDLVAQAEAGLMSITGESGGGPLPSGAPVGDFSTGMLAAFAILLGLMKRERTGVGSYVEASLMDSVAFLMVPRLMQQLVDGTGRGRMGSGHPQSTPYEAYEAADGWFVVCVTTEEYWARFCRALPGTGLAEDERFADGRTRYAHRAELTAILTAIFKEHPRRHWIDRFNSCGVICGSIRELDEVVAEEGDDERGLLREMEHPRGGTFTNLSGPVRVDGERTARWRPPPTLSADSVEVLRDAGYDDRAIAEFRRTAVVI